MRNGTMYYDGVEEMGGQGKRSHDNRRLRWATKHNACRGPLPLQALCLVEMAGIEPASKEFEQGCTTSLVGLFYFAQVSPNRQGLA